MTRIKNHAPIWTRSILAAAVLCVPAGAANVYNVDMAFTASQTYTRAGTYNWPDTPDKGSVTTADFLFNDGATHVWKINNGATIVLEQAAADVGGRFFPGVSGIAGTLTFTTDSGGPGKLSARGNSYGSMRIADSATGSGHGTVNILGGVTVEVGTIFCQYASLNATLNITDGEFAVFSTDTAKRLNYIDCNLGLAGKLWIQDATASVTSVSTFQTYATGATLTATSGNQLVFTNNVSRTPITGGAAVVGTLISVILPTPTPPAITTHPASLTASQYGPATFTVSATGSAPLSYQWKKGESELNGQTGATLTLANLTLADAGAYSVTVSNAVSSVTSDPATLTVTPYPTDVSAAGGLISRLLPAHAGQFSFAFIPPANGMDVFEIANSGERIVLRGNTPVSIASALNHYLKEICHCHVSRNGGQLALPAPLPLVANTIRVVSPHKVRFFYNPCTFGYTSAWWGWEKWQHEIDLLALDGVNVAQVIPGTEKVFLTTLRDHFGYTDAEVRAWLCMPSHLPWMLLSNMHSFGGPVPAALIDARATLGRQICDRMRSLGMAPMVQGFYGMVPQDFKSRYPAADVRAQGTWAGGLQRPNMLNPTDPIFDTFTTHYAAALNDVFGPVKYFAADPFHEGGDTTGINLTTAAQAILAGVSKANPQGTWVLEAWGSNPIQTMLDAVDKNRLLVLDLNCSNTEAWRSRAAFNNTPWVWCAIQNFGGNTGMISKLGTLASRPAAALADPAKGRMAGIGAVPEGTHTIPAAYDMLFSHAWNGTAPTLVPWVRAYTARRYGKSVPAIDAAWDILLETALNQVASIEEPHNSIICARPSLSTTIKARTWGTTDIPYDPARFAEAWGKLLEAAPATSQFDAYRFDLADIARQTLCDLATRHQRELAKAVTANNAAAVHLHGDRILEIIADLNTLCATREEWLLGRWLADARAWGTTPTEQDLCERDARMLLTTWNDNVSNLNDYANREWAGLVSGFYLPRWQQFLTALYAAVDGNTTFNETTVRTQIGAWELTWLNGHESHAGTPTGDTVAIAQALWTKYGSEATSGFDRATYTIGGSWTPAICSTLPVQWTRDVTSVINQTGVWVATFQYTSGNNALKISRAALDDGTSTIDLDQHTGWTGIANYDNRYYLRFPTLPATLNFTALTSGAGGADSNGTLTFARCTERTVGSTWTAADCATSRQIWNTDVTGNLSGPGTYQVTLARTGGSADLTVDRVWFEQNGATLAAEVRDETLTATATTQSWTLIVPSIGSQPVTLRLATGSSAAAGSTGTITLQKLDGSGGT